MSSKKKRTAGGSLRPSLEVTELTPSQALLISRLETQIHELNALNYENDAERFDDVVAELVNYGALMRTRLVAFSRSLHYQERRAAVEALGFLGYDERIEVILERLRDANWKVKRSAAFAVTHHPFHEALEPLLTLLDDAHRELRLSVIEALGTLRNTEAVAPLEGLLEDSDWRIRNDAVVALGKISHVGSFACLTRRLLDDDEDVRNATLTALRDLLPRISQDEIDEVARAATEKESASIVALFKKDGNAKQLERLMLAFDLTVSEAISIDELAPFGRVMTDPNQIETLDRAFARNEEVDNLVHILTRDGNSSVVLVGENGAGKTALIHEVARRFAVEGISVLETSTPELMVGTKYIGEWETKLRDLVEKIRAPRKVLLYLTNINDLPGAGTTSSSKQNFATLLSPYIRRGEITVIGESTPEALRVGLEKDLAIKRLFQMVKVSPPEPKDVLSVIRQQLDHLATTNSIQLTAPPETIDFLMDISGTYFSTMAQPGRSVTVLKQVIDYVLEERKRSSRHDTNDPKPIDLTPSHIIQALARSTGLPEFLLDDTIPMETQSVRAFFESRVLGQPEAVETVVDLITLVKAGLHDPTKPLGVFFFVGPTGVGKTELAKSLAEYIFGNKDRMIRFDLSEFKEYESFEKLIGGTLRNRDEGQLTSKIREQPFSVILLDEIEKAHPNVFDLFLQVFDDGRLTDARGRLADFRHSIILMTSNIASAFSPGLGFSEGGKVSMASQKGVLREVQRFFRPEFLNRIDRTVVFRALSDQTIRKIASRELGRVLLRNGLLRRKLVVDIDPSVVDVLMESGFSQAMGARPLKRAVERRVLLPVAREIVAQGPSYQGDLLRVSTDRSDPKHSKIVVERASTKAQHRHKELLEAGVTALRGSIWEDLTKHRRSWKRAQEVHTQAHNLFLKHLSIDSPSALRDSIQEAEAHVSNPSFWDEPSQARAHLTRLVSLKRRLETHTKLRSTLDLLSTQLTPPNRPKLSQWFTTFDRWLLDAQHTLEFSEETSP